MRDLQINLLTLISAAIVLFWAITDPRDKKERFTSYLKPKVIIISLFSFTFFILNYLSAKYFPLPSSGFYQLLTFAGIAIFALGAFISVWAKKSMGKVWGMPSEFDKSRQNKLVTTGPFRYSRNPIYVGLVMMLAGYGLALQSYFTFLALIPAFYFWESAKKEEILLEDYFKGEYLKYKKQVPRFF